MARLRSAISVDGREGRPVRNGLLLAIIDIGGEVVIARLRQCRQLDEIGPRIAGFHLSGPGLFQQAAKLGFQIRVKRIAGGYPEQERQAGLGRRQVDLGYKVHFNNSADIDIVGLVIFISGHGHARFSKVPTWLARAATEKNNTDLSDVRTGSEITHIESSVAISRRRPKIILLILERRARAIEYLCLTT